MPRWGWWAGGPAPAVGLFAPYVARQEEDFGFALLEFADGQADLYGTGDLGSGFMVNHVSGDAAWDFLVEVAREADLAILPPGCPTMVCREELGAHLPEELRGEAVVVTSGAQVLEVFRAC